MTSTERSVCRGKSPKSAEPLRGTNFALYGRMSGAMLIFAAVTSECCATRLFVGGLGTSATALDVREAFLNVGVQLGSIEIIMSRATGCSRGFALGTLRRPSVGTPMVSDEELFRQMRSAVVCGRTVTVLPIPPFPNYHRV